jgi:DMSO/TMAO reductase YedYZ molybdopterin-dependent catalytic subunit
MFGMDSSKTQSKPIPSPDGLGEGIIVSPDTRRENRIPPRQSRTLKWPVLDASGAPSIDLTKWRFWIEGLVVRPVSWNWEEFQALPRVKVFADFHCVTRWSRLGNLWEGVSIQQLVDRTGGSCPTQSS